MARVLKSPIQAVTLAEILIALGLLVVVVLLAIALGISSLRTNQKGSDLTVGSAWGTQILENFVYGLPDSNGPFWSSSSYTSPYQTDNIQLSNTAYQARLFIADMGTLGTGTKLVTVNVTWGNGTVGQSKAGVGLQSTSISRLLYAH